MRHPNSSGSLFGPPKHRGFSFSLWQTLQRHAIPHSLPDGIAASSVETISAGKAGPSGPETRQGSRVGTSGARRNAVGCGAGIGNSFARCGCLDHPFFFGGSQRPIVRFVSTRSSESQTGDEEQYGLAHRDTVTHNGRNSRWQLIGV